MSIVIEVVSTQVQSRSGTSQRTGKAYSMSEQSAYMHIGQPYPLQIKINLENGQPPYQPGNYDLHPQSFYVDRYNNIAVKPLLVPRPAEQRQQLSSVSGTNLPEGVQVKGNK